MAAVTLFLFALFVAIKTFSYGIWEFKRKNKVGGIFAILLALADVFLAAEYLIKYCT